MINREKRKGVSLGAIVALIASSLAFGAAPANADETLPVTNPLEGTSYTMLITEEFELNTRLGTSMNSSLIDNLTYKVEKAAGFAVSYSAQKSVGTLTGGSSISSLTDIAGATTVSYIAPGDGVNTADNVLRLQPWSTSDGSNNSITSLSASVTIHVTAFIDVNGDGDLDTGEPAGTRRTVTFVPWATLGATLAVTPITAGATTATVSATIPSTVNLEQLNNNFILDIVGDSQALTVYGGDSKSSAVSGAHMAQKGSTALSLSASLTDGAPADATSYSARLFYGTAGQGTQIAVSNVDSSVESVGVISIAPVVGANISDDEVVRPNQTYTIKVHAKTGSVSVSGAVLNVSMTGAALSIGAKEISINGAASTTSYPTALAVTTGADGYASFTVKTFGFVNEDQFTVTVKKAAVTQKSLTFTTKDPVYTVTDDFSFYATAPGTAANLTYQVKDQWGELSSRTDQRLKLVRASTTGFNYSETTSYVAVSGGKATFTYTGQPATATGSTTVGVTLQRLNSNNGVYVADSGSSGVTSNINVSSTTDAFATGLAASYAASVSYWPNTVSWVTVTGNVANSGSAVAIAGPSDLIFRISSDVATTYSGALSLRASSTQGYSFQVASLKAGSHTMTLTNGSATTTSLLVVDPVSDDYGASMTFDVSNIVPGKTAIVTGTLVDANGNPVDTTGEDGDATIAVTYTGTAGIPVGTMPTETNADGEFKISILTSAADNGSMTLTATYMKDGSSTATADKITSTHVITVGAAEASADQKITVGTFKGYVAIYTKGYMGQKLSAKVAGKWLVVDPIAAFKSNDYSRTVRLTGAGYTITVDLYIDGAFVRSEVVTTK